MNCSATSEHLTSRWPVLDGGATHPPDLDSPPPQSPTNQHSNQHQHPNPFLTNLIFLGIPSFPLTLEKENVSVPSPYLSLRASSYQVSPHRSA